MSNMSNQSHPDQKPQEPADHNQAVDLIRNKIAGLYAEEPDIVSGAIDSIQEPVQTRTKHQRFMADLASSGKPFAQIQTEWHNYYQSLPDREKHEVWNEFYSAQGSKPHFKSQAVEKPASPLPDTFTGGVFSPPEEPIKRSVQNDTVADLKKQLANRVQARGKLSRKQHLKSLAFGVGVGSFTVLLLLFGFFNERFIAPFITPSRTVSSTPLISDSLSGEVGPEPKLIIPKINVELPVVYDLGTVEESAVQTALEDGVVHYATTSQPGQVGNGAIFGHSSNNILNRGKYKFAFVLLSRLESGDTFYIEKDGVRYVYRVFDKRVVSPSEVSVLNDVEGKTSTMALITCDPPGTTINRLVVWGEQISPDPDKNVASTAIDASEDPQMLAGNPESLWSRIWNGIF